MNKITRLLILILLPVQMLALFWKRWSKRLGWIQKPFFTISKRNMVDCQFYVCKWIWFCKIAKWIVIRTIPY